MLTENLMASIIFEKLIHEEINGQANIRRTNTFIFSCLLGFLLKIARIKKRYNHKDLTLVIYRIVL